MLSFVGTTPFFHTPQDTPANTTRPAALAAAAEALGNAVSVFLTDQP
jgi:hypothetical protein